MEIICQNLGSTLKTIRENKGYTQKDISERKMSRSNYSKVENNDIIPNVFKFFDILDYMDMSEAEFSFISNGYKLSEKDAILCQFTLMDHSPSLAYIDNLIETSRSFLERRKDRMVQDIFYIASGYRALISEHDLESARTFAGKVWDRLKKLDKLYLSEFHLLNRILYFFELETATALTDSALRDLNAYFCFQEAEDLKISYLGNLTCMLIDNDKHDTALPYIEQMIRESKKKPDAIALAGALVRKGICQDAVGNTEKSKASFDTAVSLFQMMGRVDLAEQTRQSPEIVHNPYGYIRFH